MVPVGLPQANPGATKNTTDAVRTNADEPAVTNALGQGYRDFCIEKMADQLVDMHAQMQDLQQEEETKKQRPLLPKQEIKQQLTPPAAKVVGVPANNVGVYGAGPSKEIAYSSLGAAPLPTQQPEVTTETNDKDGEIPSGTESLPQGGLGPSKFGGYNTFENPNPATELTNDSPSVLLVIANLIGAIAGVGAMAAAFYLAPTVMAYAAEIPVAETNAEWFNDAANYVTQDEDRVATLYGAASVLASALVGRGVFHLTKAIAGCCDSSPSSTRDVGSTVPTERSSLLKQSH